MPFKMPFLKPRQPSCARRCVVLERSNLRHQQARNPRDLSPAPMTSANTYAARRARHSVNMPADTTKPAPIATFGDKVSLKTVRPMELANTNCK